MLQHMPGHEHTPVPIGGNRYACYHCGQMVVMPPSNVHVRHERRYEDAVKLTPFTEHIVL